MHPAHVAAQAHAPAPVPATRPSAIVRLAGRILALALSAWWSGSVSAADAPAAASPAPAADTFTSATWGFQLQAPVEADDRTHPQSQQVALFFLRPSDGFAPNVNVLFQAYTGTLAAYDTVSRQQFTQRSWQLIKGVSDKEGITYEYLMPVTNPTCQQAHAYARVTKVGGGVVLVTAVALTSQWPTCSQALIASVDSYRQSGR